MELIGLEKTKEGKYLKNYELTYINNAGREKKYEIVSHSEITDPSQLGKRVSGMAIVGIHRGKMLLLKEFRMGVNRTVFNLCAGMLEADETMEECVARELFEETGLKLKRIIKVIPPAFAAVALTDIKNQLVFAEVEGDITDSTSENEQIKAAFYSKEEVAKLIENEEFSSRAQSVAYFFSIGAMDNL